MNAVALGLVEKPLERISPGNSTTIRQRRDASPRNSRTESRPAATTRPPKP
jgi:hypothetical protein